MIINGLRALAAAGFDALAQFTAPVADAIWADARRRPLAELTLLEEIADHAGTMRAQLEDIRNLLQQQNSLALGLPGLSGLTPVCSCGYAYKRSGRHTAACPASILDTQPTK